MPLTPGGPNTPNATNCGPPLTPSATTCGPPLTPQEINNTRTIQVSAGGTQLTISHPTVTTNNNMVNKQFVVPGNGGGGGGGRRDTVGSEVSDDDNKMVICEDRLPDAHHDHTKTGQWRQLQDFPGSLVFSCVASQAYY